MNERAVSHMVGFILIFGIIMTGATFALFVGQDAIEDVSGFEQSRNAERAMTLLGQDLDHLAFTRAVSSETAMNIDDGQIRHDNVSTIDVTVDTSGGPPHDWTFPTGSIVNEYGDATLRYENGMVIHASEGGATARTAPEVSCTADRAIISVVTLQGDEDRQLGSGRVTVDAFLNESVVAYPINATGADTSSDATSVTIDVVDSPYEDVWERYLAGETDWAEAPADGSFECVVGANGEVVVRQVTIDLEFQR